MPMFWHIANTDKYWEKFSCSDVIWQLFHLVVAIEEIEKNGKSNCEFCPNYAIKLPKMSHILSSSSSPDQTPSPMPLSGMWMAILAVQFVHLVKTWLVDGKKCLLSLYYNVTISFLLKLWSPFMLTFLAVYHDFAIYLVLKQSAHYHTSSYTYTW